MGGRPRRRSSPTSAAFAPTGAPRRGPTGAGGRGSGTGRQSRGHDGRRPPPDGAPRRHGADPRGVRHRRPRRPRTAGRWPRTRSGTPGPASTTGPSGGGRSPPGSTPTWPAAGLTEAPEVAPVAAGRAGGGCGPHGPGRTGRLHDGSARRRGRRRSPIWPTAPRRRRRPGGQGGGGHPRRTVRRARQRPRRHPPLPQELGARLLPAPGAGPCQPPARHHDQRPLRPRPQRGARRRAPTLGPRHLGAGRRDRASRGRPPPCRGARRSWRPWPWRSGWPTWCRRGPTTRSARSSWTRGSARSTATPSTPSSTCCGRSRTAAGWSGVISHVQELKDALPNGITIASTHQGSVAEIHYPDA